MPEDHGFHEMQDQGLTRNTNTVPVVIRDGEEISGFKFCPDPADWQKLRSRQQ